MRIKTFLILLFVLCGIQNSISRTHTDSASEENSQWVRPTGEAGSKPMWGFKDGIRVAIDPIAIPRGLISIHTPYLDFPEMHILQFIALEPVVKEAQMRGYSELEWSRLDSVQGKHFWSSNTPEVPVDNTSPASGVISKENGVETLTVYILSEKFDNGAEVYVKIKFTEGRPYEFEITPCVTKDSKELERFVLTATMGNKTRLRNLYLDGGVVLQSTDIWPEHRGGSFTDHFHVSPSNMVTDGKGGVWFIAAPNEMDTSNATYAPGTGQHWKYTGKRATQYWHCPRPGDELMGVVNGRYTYYLSEHPIPGGIAFENFELTEPYVAGQSYTFGITPETPEEFIKQIK